LNIAIFLPAVAFGVSALVSALLARRLLPVPMDRPNARSLHASPVPRAGGIAILTAWSAVLPWLGPDACYLVPAAALFLVSFADDVRGVPVAWRLLAQLLASAGFVLLCLPETGVGARLATILALVWMTNLFNFMDGSDGLAAGMAAFGFGSYALAALLAGMPEFGLLNGALAAACLGFLLLNFHPARIFLGDAGSVPLGFLAGALGMWGVASGCWPVSFPPLVFLPFVADATVTLVRRFLRGVPVWQAHREHYYQRLVQLGWGHRGTALVYYALMAGAAVSALAVLQTHADLLWVLLLVWLGVFAALFRVVDRFWMRCRVTSENK
jgi:UDP-N-acetylmuramyl pentapeptide phosphotransferase/UDP-N-acetylglucosamine-1-phosphate transferase